MGMLDNQVIKLLFVNWMIQYQTYRIVDFSVLELPIHIR